MTNSGLAGKSKASLAGPQGPLGDYGVQAERDRYAGALARDKQMREDLMNQRVDRMAGANEDFRNFLTDDYKDAITQLRAGVGIPTEWDRSFVGNADPSNPSYKNAVNAVGYKNDLRGALEKRAGFGAPMLGVTNTAEGNQNTRYATDKSFDVKMQESADTLDGRKFAATEGRLAREHAAEQGALARRHEADIKDKDRLAGIEARNVELRHKTDMERENRITQVGGQAYDEALKSNNGDQAKAFAAAQGVMAAARGWTMKDPGQEEQKASGSLWWKKPALPYKAPTYAPPANQYDPVAVKLEYEQAKRLAGNDKHKLALIEQRYNDFQNGAY